MRLTITTLILAVALTLIGCSAQPNNTNNQTNQVAVADKKAKGDGVNDKPIVRCGSKLTKTGKPCQNRVREDSYCYLHAEKEAAKAK